MNKKSVIFLLCLFLTDIYTTVANPLPVQLNHEKEGIIDRLGRWGLVQYCKKHNIQARSLNALNKAEIIKTDAHRSAILLVYEFATNTGPAHSYWYDYHPYTQSFKQGPGMQYVCATFFHMNDSTSLRSIQDIRYQFSPLLVPFTPQTWPFAVKQHVRVLKAYNFSQFVLGSFNVKVEVLPNDMLHFTVFNKMSRKSLMLGFGPRVDRPRILGTTCQTLSFTLTKEEAKAMAQKN